MKIKFFITLLIIFILFLSVKIIKNDNKKNENIYDSYSGEEVFSNFNEDMIKSSSELQLLIYKTPKNETLLIKDNFYLNYSLTIDKPIKIDFNNKKIYSKNLINLFTVNSSDVLITNGVFFNIDTPFLIQSSSDKFSNISVESSIFFLERKSSLMTNSNNFKFINNYVFINENIIGEECSLFNYNGKNIIFKNNFLLDKSMKCNQGISISGSDNIEISDNIVVSHIKEYMGVINISNTKNIILKNNLLLDNNKTNRIYNMGSESDSPDPFNEEEYNYHEGSIGIKLFNNENVEIIGNIFNTEFLSIQEDSFILEKENKKVMKVFIQENIMNSTLSISCEFYNFLQEEYQINNLKQLINNCQK